MIAKICGRKQPRNTDARDFGAAIARWVSQKPKLRAGIKQTARESIAKHFAHGRRAA